MAGNSPRNNGNDEVTIGHWIFFILYGVLAIVSSVSVLVGQWLLIYLIIRSVFIMHTTGVFQPINYVFFSLTLFYILAMKIVKDRVQNVTYMGIYLLPLRYLETSIVMSLCSAVAYWLFFDSVMIAAVVFVGGMIAYPFYRILDTSKG